jgi:hypothetical protein
MAKFKIYAGLGGGFGGANFRGIEDCNTIDDAEEFAYWEAVEVYQSYEGLHGLMSWDEVKEDLIVRYGTDIDEDDIRVAYNEEMDSWLDFYVKEVPDNYEEEEDEY